MAPTEVAKRPKPLELNRETVRRLTSGGGRVQIYAQSGQPGMSCDDSCPGFPACTLETLAFCRPRTSDTCL